MENTIKILMTTYFGSLAAAVAIAVVFMSGIVEQGMWKGESLPEYYVATLMELSTLALAFASLRLFKWGRVKAELVALKAPALRRWGTMRILMLSLPLLLNTLLYYAFLNPSFGYMAILLLLCMCFVFPTRGKCEYEVSE